MASFKSLKDLALIQEDPMYPLTKIWIANLFILTLGIYI